jgi:hypothetical protein
LLTKPLARYGAKGAEAQDGGLFCFVHGTDPEVLLMLERGSDVISLEKPASIELENAIHSVGDDP